MILPLTLFVKPASVVLLAGIFFVFGLHGRCPVLAQSPAPKTSAPVILRSTFENLSRGFIPAGLPPALRVESGQIVQIETFSHHGFVDDPVAFFKNYGISAEMILPDLITASKKLPRPKDGGTHVLTGPIYIEGAELGDMLEVRILDVKPGCLTAGMAAARDAVSSRIF
jgi:hypothetical protein